VRILLDTHFFLWWDSQPQQLSPQARVLCEDAKNTLVLSVASAWEMQIKQHLGKLKLRLPLAELIADQQNENGIEILPIGLSHVLALEKLPMHHKDPFDRLLIAQATAENIGILSADAIFKQYEVNLLL